MYLGSAVLGGTLSPRIKCPGTRSPRTSCLGDTSEGDMSYYDTPTWNYIKQNSGANLHIFQGGLVGWLPPPPMPLDQPLKLFTSSLGTIKEVM